jgi:dipeptidyl-peptidase-4
MRTLILLSLSFLLAALTVVAREAPQTKEAPLDVSYLRDHAQTRGFQLGRPSRPKITPDGKAVLFLRAEARSPRQSLYEFDVTTGQTRELVSPQKLLPGADEKLSPEEKARRERQRVNVGGFTSFQLSPDGNLVLIPFNGRLYVADRHSPDVEELKTGRGTLLDPKFSPDGARVSYILDHDLYVLDKNGRETRITRGGKEKKTNGLAEFVAQEEMGRFTGYWWSPDSKGFAFEEADADGVETWFVADPIRPEQPPHASYYPRPGKANVKVRLGLILATGSSGINWVQWDTDEYPYLADVRWDKEGPLTILVQSRDQQRMSLLEVEPSSGRTLPLVTCADQAWVNIVHDTPRWLPDGTFLWTNQTKTGYQLEQHSREGELLRVLAAPDSGYRELVGVDRTNRVLYVRGSIDPTQMHLFALPLSGDERRQMTSDEGVHSPIFAKEANLYVLTSSSRKSMPRSFVCQPDGKVVGELPSVAEDPPFVPKDEILKVGDGPGYWTAVVRPHDFQPGKKYPVIVHVYGGPGHQQVLAPMSMRLLDQWLADQGFIVVSVDNPGTPGRGRDWEKAIYLDFANVPLKGQAAGLRALGKQFKELDLERVGIYGWSFGGYMSAQAVLREPDLFKVGVAGAPVTEWLDYDTHYTERYLNLPDKAEAAYANASLLPLAKELRRPLMLIHGTADDNVYFRHTLRLADALFRAGKDFELLPLPGLTHMVPDPEVNQRLYGKIAGYFRQHLGAPK